MRQNVDKSQKEYFLREQLKAIHTELGDDGKEEDELREKIKQKGLPQELEEKCLKEIDRMSKMQSSSPEYTVLAGYIEQVLSMPWTEETTDTIRAKFGSTSIIQGSVMKSDTGVFRPKDK